MFGNYNFKNSSLQEKPLQQKIIKDVNKKEEKKS